MPELPFVARDPGTQQNFDALNKRTGTLEARFPVVASDLATSAKELFPQLVTAAGRKINFGESEVEFTAKGLVTAFKAIAHGLGVKPVYVDVSFVAGEDGGIWSTPLFKNVGATNFEVRFRTDTERAAGTKFGISWIAIG